jgi:hypothetical protein
MRQLKYYVACTVDRFIAHRDGTHEGFLIENYLVPQVPDSITSKLKCCYRVSRIFLMVGNAA